MPDTIFASESGGQQNIGQALVAIAAGDVITLRNHTSFAAIGLVSQVAGTAANTSASIILKKIS